MDSILVGVITAPISLNTCLFSTPVNLDNTLVISLISTLVSLFSTFLSHSISTLFNVVL